MICFVHQDNVNEALLCCSLTVPAHLAPIQWILWFVLRLKTLGGHIPIILFIMQTHLRVKGAYRSAPVSYRTNFEPVLCFSTTRSSHHLCSSPVNRVKYGDGNGMTCNQYVLDNCSLVYQSKLSHLQIHQTLMVERLGSSCGRRPIPWSLWFVESVATAHIIHFGLSAGFESQFLLASRCSLSTPWA